MRTSPGPGVGIGRVPKLTGLPISATKSAFCIFGTLFLEKRNFLMRIYVKSLNREQI
jgi:hypothetical protein